MAEALYVIEQVICLPVNSHYNMIMMKNWMSSLKGLGMHWAATAKTKKTQSARSLPTLVNDNLRFEARNCELFMVPKHPKLAPGSERSVVIDTSSVILQLFFVKKSTNKLQEEHEWQQSEVFDFRFEQLAALLDIQCGLGQEYSTSHFSQAQEKPEKYVIKVSDKAAEKRIKFSKSSELQESNSVDKKVQFEESISYEDFGTMQTILQESLYDLSGMRLILDVKRMEELEKVKNLVNRARQETKDVQDFYGQKSN